MKRLIPAVIILVCIISICICANVYVGRTCEQMLDTIDKYYADCTNASNTEINQLTNKLKSTWYNKKEKLALFINHSFLDKTTVYINELPVIIEDGTHHEFMLTYANIKTLFSQMKAEQKFALHSFY